MSDDPNPDRGGNRPAAASPTRSGLLQKVWLGVNNRIPEIIVTLILAGLSYIAYHSWDTILSHPLIFRRRSFATVGAYFD